MTSLSSLSGKSSVVTGSLIVSLCSPENRDITGAAIPIDGGWSAM